jgi:hypothetical protein
VSGRSLRQAASSTSYVKGDEDVDAREGSGNDYDDGDLRGYGREAGAGDATAVAALVARYFTAAAHDDGSQVCALLDSRVAKSADFAQVVPPSYVSAGDPSALRGKSCAQVASLLLNIDHSQLAVEAPSVRVTSLRVLGDHGVALLGFATTPERQIPVRREGATWKLDSFLDTELP